MSITDERIPDLDDFSDLSDDNLETSAGTVHTGVSSSRSGGTPRRGRRPAAKRLDSLQKRLSGQMFQIGTMAGFAFPTMGRCWQEDSDPFTKATVELAATRPEWIAALESIAKIEPGIVIAKTVFRTGAALAVDRGKVDPDKKMLQFLGVTAAYYAVHNPDMNMESGNAYQPPPAKFTPVS